MRIRLHGVERVFFLFSLCVFLFFSSFHLLPMEAKAVEVCVRERMGKEETYGIFDSDGLSVSLPGCLTGRPGWFGLDWTGLD